MEAQKQQSPQSFEDVDNERLDYEITPMSVEEAMHRVQMDIELMSTPDNELTPNQLAYKRKIQAKRAKDKEEYEKRQIERLESQNQKVNYKIPAPKTHIENRDEFRFLLLSKRSHRISPQGYKQDFFVNCLYDAYQNDVEGRGVYSFNDTDIILNLCKTIGVWMYESRKNGLLIMGQVGCGKSTLMRAFKETCRILRLADIQLENASVIANKVMSNTDAVIEYGNAKNLIIDDLGKEQTNVSNYGNTIQVMSEIISIRYDKQLPTFITSNLIMSKELNPFTKYGTRTADRLREMCGFITIEKGGSYRK